MHFRQPVLPVQFQHLLEGFRRFRELSLLEVGLAHIVKGVPLEGIVFALYGGLLELLEGGGRISELEKRVPHVEMQRRLPRILELSVAI